MVNAMDTTDPKTQFAAVKRAQGGHRESLAKLLRRVGDLMFVYVYWLTLDRDLAEDLAQDATLYVLRHLNERKIDTLSAFWIWTYRSTLKMVLDRRGGRGQILPSCDIDPEDGTQREAAEHLTGLEMTTAVMDAMAALKFDYRHVLVLRSLGKMHYRQMAQILGIGHLETRWLVFCAKRGLKRQLADRQFEKNHLSAALGLFGAGKAEPDPTGCLAPVQAEPHHFLIG